MGLLLGPSVVASPSEGEFVIGAIQESAEITVIQETATFRPLPEPPTSPVATYSAIMQVREVLMRLEILAEED